MGVQGKAILAKGMALNFLLGLLRHDLYYENCLFEKRTRENNEHLAPRLFTSNNNEQKLHEKFFGAKRSVHRKIGKSTIAQSGLTKKTSAKQSLRACSLRLAFVKHKKTACRIAKKTTQRCAYSKTTS